MELGRDRGGEPVKGYISGEAAVFRNADDRMEVAVADAARDTRVTYQQGTPSGTWTSEQDNWPSLDKISVGDPAVAQSEDGIIAVFIRGSDNRFYVGLWGRGGVIAPSPLSGSRGRGDARPAR
ncbi:hypothetical protein AB0E25_33975 [Streptomyces bobili]|uniref:hypothetical protein n=1 Tax=Streptomyces bobili TaxID=67280 RepID=UPI0033EAAA95